MTALGTTKVFESSTEPPTYTLTSSEIYVDSRGVKTLVAFWFSFLLNSHHKLFVDADMTAEDSCEASRAAMMEKAMKVGVTALMQQIDFGP